MNRVIEAGLQSKERETRLEAAVEAGRNIREGLLKRTATSEVNNHVHTAYSYSPYSPSMAVLKAWVAGLQAVGCMDHDSVSGAEEMLDAGKSIGMATTVGFEVRVNLSGTSLEGRRLNNPDSLNIAYMTVHGIARKHLKMAAQFLKPINKERNKRNRREVTALNALMNGSELEALDFDKDIYLHSRASEGGSITERHILAAMAEKLITKFDRGDNLIQFLQNNLGIELSKKQYEYLLDSSNPHYLYDLLGILKSSFLDKFFIQPNETECIPVKEVIKFALAVNAIPCYAYLGDVTESPTGDKKAQKFEDDYLDELFPELKKLGFLGITYMPPRNTDAQLKRIQKLCSKYDFFEISGVDINSSRQSFNCPEILRDEYSHLLDATWALIAHEKLAECRDSFAFFSPSNPLNHLSLQEKTSLYSRIGRQMNVEHPENIIALFPEVKTNSFEADLLDAAPTIRGMTYDGHKGKIILFNKDIDQRSEAICLDCDDDWKETLTLLFEKEKLEKGVLPGIVCLEGLGTFYLGEDWQEAEDLHSGKLDEPVMKAQVMNRNNLVRNKVAVVTGGAQGFGAGMVQELVEAGCHVIIADMNLDGASKLAETLNKQKGRVCAHAVSVNVTDEKSVEEMMHTIVSLTGGFDLFISNAGVLKAGSVKEMTLKDFNFVTSVDYTGFFICTKFAARVLASQNESSGDYSSDIIAISSKSGLEGSNKNGAYAGAKFGTIGLVQSFALELVSDNVKVNAICPGNFLDGPLWSDPDRGLFVQYLNAGKVPGAKTLADVRNFYESKVPLNRGCTTEDVMKAVFYIVDQQYETGQAVPVTGGQVMLN